MCIKEIFSKKIMKIANSVKSKMQMILNGLKKQDVAGDQKIKNIAVAVTDVDKFRIKKYQHN